MGLYLSGKRIPGICERCSRRVPLDELNSEVERGKDKGNAVCSECHDPDHPQNWVGSRPVADRQSVKDAQPEPRRTEVNSLFGFDPVGAPGNSIQVKGGIVSIV
jgi:hypothetical protein